MNNRLKQFLAAENITQSQFADTIKVVRASVSHVLSGRNNPGYDFIKAIMAAYPKLSMEWLILGKGKMYKEAETSPTETLQEIPSFQNIQPDGNLFDYSDDSDYQEDHEVPEPAPDSPAPDSVRDFQSHRQSFNADNTAQRVIHQRSVSKIIIFFDDGTYQELSY